MKTMPVPPTAGRATCSDPDHLPLVDAAFEKPGGPEAQEMKRTLCRHCPVQAMCATWAMTHREAGVWGGTAPKWRTQNGGPKDTTVPRPVRPAVVRERTTTRPPNATAIRCAELGVRESEVKAWAYERGLVRSIRGRVSLAVVEAWAAARQAA